MKKEALQFTVYDVSENKVKRIPLFQKDFALQRRASAGPAEEHL